MKLPKQVYQHNICEWVNHPQAGEKVISRIPESLRVKLNENAQERALCSAGCELRFRLNSPTATIRIRACSVLAKHHGGGLAQLLFGDFSATYIPVTEDLLTYELVAPDYEQLETVPSQERQFHPRLVRLLLPTHASICEVSIEGDIAPPEASDMPALRVLNYGSSITHGSGALSCRESWAGRCAHLLGADLMNLGFGGGCHCEPEMTEYLCQRNDFDWAILETGINMLGLDLALVKERIAGLITRFSVAHPSKPVYCLGVFPCREDILSDYAGRAQEIREWVQEVVRTADAPNLHFIDGREAMEPALGLTTDLVHPSPAGMIEIAHYVAERIKAIQGGA